MTWCHVQEHDAVADRFRRAVQESRMANSFLFIGPSGIGKRLFAMRLAQVFLCERNPPKQWMPCRECHGCQQVEAGSHADLHLLERRDERTMLTLDQFIGDREHRMQAGLCHHVALRPSKGRRRIAIVDDADYLNEASANALLKTLEEPPLSAVIILVGTSEQRQLPTVRSRCQVVRFQPLSDVTVKRLLIEHRLVDEQLIENDTLFDQVVAAAQGSLDRARSLANPALIRFHSDLEKRWDRSGEVSVKLASDIRKFVDQAGTAAGLRRDRLRTIIELRTRSLRRQLHTVLREASAGEHHHHEHEQVERLTQQIDRCLEALQQIDANANLATLIECWVDDLSLA